MSAWDPQDHGWLYGGLLGIVILVFAGIILSLVIDNRTGVSSGIVELQAGIRERQERLDQLVVEKTLLEQRWAERRPALHHEARLEDLTEFLGPCRARHRELEASITATRGGIAALEAADHAYRIDYHRAAREALVGRDFGEFVMADGTRYAGVRVTGADDEGLSIRHAHGGAKLRYPELPTEWKERLQWSPLLGIGGPSGPEAP